MADQQLQTSVFITNGTHQQTATRESVSGRPLLSTSSSVGKRTTSQTNRRTFMTSLPSRNVLLFLILLAALVTATIVIVIVMTSSEHPMSSSLTNDECEVFKTVPIDSTANGHVSCSGTLQVSEGCVSETVGAWTVFYNVSQDWNRSLTYIPKEIHSFSSIVVSPPYKLSPQVCSLQLSCSFASASKLRAFLVDGNVTKPIVMSEDQCHYGYTEDMQFLSSHSSLRVIVVSNSKIELGGSSATVTSHGCVKYQMLAIVPRPPTSRPYFAYVGLGKKDVCTVEIHNSTSVDCRWWNVGEIDNGEFVRSEADSCMSQGAPSQNPHATWFLLMTPDDVDKRAYVISPKMQGGVSHLILSLWYAIKCDGSFLRAYVIRSIRDIRTVTSQSEYLLEIKGLKTTIHWKFESFQLAIPTNFETFHVVLEGFTPVNASCTGYLCYNNVDFVHPYPTKALVAIDKMSLELKHDQCNLTVKNQSHELDCRFQDSNNSFTYCTWTSFSPYGDIAYPEFNSWVGENSGDVIDDRHGATLEHLEGRGYILRFDGLGNTNSEHYLRSPKVVANSNCSCVMSFLYLLRGVWAPRLEVNLIYDDGTEDGLSVSHWSRHGHVSDNWETATALLNLQTGHSFQVEILVKDITDSKGDAHIDDLLFYECDMSIQQL